MYGGIRRYWRCTEIYGDLGRCGGLRGGQLALGRCTEMYGGIQRYWEMWGDTGRYGEMWGDVAACAAGSSRYPSMRAMSAVNSRGSSAPGVRG